VLWHGTQRGQVMLAERKLQITHPRLRSKATSKEVAVPAYGECPRTPVIAYRAVIADGRLSFSRGETDVGGSKGIER